MEHFQTLGCRENRCLWLPPQHPILYAISGMETQHQLEVQPGAKPEPEVPPGFQPEVQPGVQGERGQAQPSCGGGGSKREVAKQANTLLFLCHFFKAPNPILIYVVRQHCIYIRDASISLIPIHIKSCQYTAVTFTEKL